MNQPLTLGRLGGLQVVPVQKRSPFINMLVYGESGTGKTTLAGSATEVEELHPVIVIDIEGGTESLVRPYPDVHVVRVMNWAQMQLVYDQLRRGDHPYKTVVLDSLTEIQKFNMYNIMEKVIEESPERDPDVPSMREWGINLEQMRKMVRAFRDLPMNTIFTALVKDDKDQLTGRSQIKPSLSGKLASEVAGFLDIVCYYYIKQLGSGDQAELIRLLLTQRTDKQVAKDRTGRLPMIMQKPTMKDIWDYVMDVRRIQEVTVSDITPVTLLEQNINPTNTDDLEKLTS